jgi:hypothetical protein
VSFVAAAAQQFVSSPPRTGPDAGILADAISRFLPEQRNILQLSWALADPKRLEHLLASAGFREIRVGGEEREGFIESFDDYWDPIEAGVGSIPQAYLTLSEADRRSVREEVKARLSPFQSDGRLLMSIELLIGSGRAERPVSSESGVD